MCNNMTIKRGQAYYSKEVLACADALESLKTVWARNNSCGVATIWTTEGPRPFNMAKISPRDALVALKDETGAPWKKIEVWTRPGMVDVDALY